jgi:(R,R)-butanediol dehydrogenase/meso-butanediol dehydrogenase/diacetyl reductase
MKGVVFCGDQQVEVSQFPDPRPGPGEAVVRLRASGLCGTDLHRYRESAAQRAPNRDKIYGHEPSGVIEAIGPDVRGLRVGERVSVYHYRGCGRCKYCRAGYIHWCPERRGGTAAYADLVVTDAVCCLPLPDTMSYACGAAIACFLGTAFSAMRKLQTSGEHTLAIFGLGPVGLGGLLVAKALGARVIGVEPIAERRSLAVALGADEVIDPQAVDPVAAVRDSTYGEGAALAFETAGSEAAHAATVACLRHGGKAVFAGLGIHKKTIDIVQTIDPELTLMGSHVMPLPMYWDLVDFIVEHALPVDRIVTHRLPIDRAADAFRLFESGKTGKVILEWAE